MHPSKNVTYTYADTIAIDRNLQSEHFIPQPILLADDGINTVHVSHRKTQGFVCIWPTCTHRAITYPGMAKHLRGYGVDVSLPENDKKIMESRYTVDPGYGGDTGRRKRKALDNSPGHEESADEGLGDDGEAGDAPNATKKIKATPQKRPSKLRNYACPCVDKPSVTSNELKFHIMYDHRRTEAHFTAMKDAIDKEEEVTDALKGSQPSAPPGCWQWPFQQCNGARIGLNSALVRITCGKHTTTAPKIPKPPKRVLGKPSLTHSSWGHSIEGHQDESSQCMLRCLQGVDT